MLARVLCIVVVALAAFGALPVLAGPSFAQAKPTGAAALHAEKREKLVVDQSQRHLEYGLELRKQGLPTQAAAQIVLAAEIGHGKNAGADLVLRIMRQYDASFWKRHGSHPSKSKIEAYEKKARELLLRDEKERLDLANWGEARGVDTHADYVAILLARDEPLLFDAKGQIVLASGTIPKEPSEKIRADAVTINGALYVRDELLAKLASVKAIYEVTTDALRVRTTTSLADAKDLHAMCTQLLPELEKDMGAKPARRLPVYVFGKREEYDASLDALDLADHKIATGLAAQSPLVALACSQDDPPDVARGVVLHELTHLYGFAVSYSVFPSWYAEGYADMFGGTDTFAWDGTKLTVLGLLSRSRIEALKQDGGTMKLRDLLDADQLEQWRRGKEFGLAFYAQSWAFLRWLRSAAPDDVRERFEQWEDRCRGQALGYEVGASRAALNRPGGARKAATDLLLELFGKDLAKIEDGFHAWLATL